MFVPNPRTAAARATGPRGFSLVEILAAVVLIGVMASVAAPRVTTLAKRIQLDAAAQQVLGDLARARTEAIKRNAPVKVTFGVTGYTIQYVGARTLEGASFTTAPDSVLFAPFGPPSMGGATFVVAMDGRSKTITLNAAGHAKVQ